jgi:hypothetical protein
VGCSIQNWNFIWHLSFVFIIKLNPVSILHLLYFSFTHTLYRLTIYHCLLILLHFLPQCLNVLSVY